MHVLKLRCQLDICISPNPVGTRWYSQYNYKEVLMKEAFPKLQVARRESTKIVQHWEGR